MNALVNQVRRDFADDAPLPAGLPGYLRRDEQIKLAAELSLIHL